VTIKFEILDFDLFEVQTIKMGFDLYFVDPIEKTTTEKIMMSYSYNKFNSFLNLSLLGGKSGAEMIRFLEHGILNIKNNHVSLGSSRDLLLVTPGNYLKILDSLLTQAQSHPTWIFCCDM
jgi:hypothetical protein